jgi:signal transduction histidine kinase
MAANDQRHETAADEPCAFADAERLSQRLGRRYRFVLIVVAVLVVLDQAVIQPLLVRLNFYAPVINVAGRQRMLSQRLTKAALAIQAATSDDVAAERRAELSAALGQWTAAHYGLIEGSDALGIPPTVLPEILADFRSITPHFDAMHDAARQIASAGAGDREAVARSVSDILVHESQYLPRMDRIVGLYEREAGRQVVWLRLMGLTVMAALLALLMGVGWFVLRPATRTIQRQIGELVHSRERLSQARDELEARVVERTRELHEANVSLEREMHERLQAEERTQQLSLQLSHASRITAIGQLATGLAHEINQPLSAIVLYAESAEMALSADRPRLDETLSIVDRIRKAALRAGHLVRSMRNFVRPGQAEYREAEIGELIDEVRELVQSEVEKSGATLHVDVPGDIPPARVNRIQIQQVLLNLLQNALQAMQTSHAKNRRLDVSCRVEDVMLRVEVADTGSGFPPQNFEDAFQPFYTTKPEGLGMGLAICRTIVRQHGGELTAANRPHGGAIVAFTIPAPVTHGNPAREADCVCRG